MKHDGWIALGLAAVGIIIFSHIRFNDEGAPPLPGPFYTPSPAPFATAESGAYTRVCNGMTWTLQPSGVWWGRPLPGSFGPRFVQQSSTPPC